MIDKRITGMGNVLLVLRLNGKKVIIHLRFFGKGEDTICHALKQVQRRVGTGIHKAFRLLHGKGIGGFLLASREGKQNNPNEYR